MGAGVWGYGQRCLMGGGVGGAAWGRLGVAGGGVGYAVRGTGCSFGSLGIELGEK